jgi:hypothetical protein
MSDDMEDSIRAILAEFGEAAYWYVDETDDHLLQGADGEKFFRKAVFKLKELAREKPSE